MIQKPQQDALISISDQTGQMHVHDFSEGAEFAVTNRVEQKIQLINVLGFLAAAKSSDGAASIGASSALTERYGDKSLVVAKGAKRHANEYRATASQVFDLAVGMRSLVDSGFTTEKGARRLSQGMFSDFLKEYYLPTSGVKSTTYRKQLKAEIDDLQSQQTSLNRQHGLRPHAMVADKKSSTELAYEEAPTLNTRDRMLAISEDVRAGFLPRSNAEKNKVLTFLDYLDNPDYPMGINNQLFEVMIHRQKYRVTETGKPSNKKGSSKDAIRAIESIVWELGDYFLDANFASGSLMSLKDAMYNASPSVMLHELDDVGADHPGIVRLIRDIEIRKFVETGQSEIPGGDPLAGTNVRTVISTDNTPGRHKTVFDQYTRPDMGTSAKTSELDQYLKARISNLTVGEARRTIDIAIVNENVRSYFMRQLLLDVLDLNMSRSMKQVVDAAQNCLQNKEANE